MSKPTLVIISCSKMKADHPDKAKDFYRGDVFIKSQRWIVQEGYDELIISAKYGVISPDFMCEYYDIRVRNLTQARKLREKSSKKLKEFFLRKNYGQIILIMGNFYYEVVRDFIENVDVPVYRMESKNGIFDYKKNVIKLLNGDRSVLYKLN